MSQGERFEGDALNASLDRSLDQTRPMLDRDGPAHFHHRAMGWAPQAEVSRHLGSGRPSLDNVADGKHEAELLHNVAIRVNAASTHRSNQVATKRGMGTPGNRLSAARKRAGFASARAAALDLGLPVSTYNAHERAGEPGGREFGVDDAARYGRRYSVSPAWLLTGEGDAKGGIPLLSWVSAGELLAEGGDIDFSSVRRLQVSDLPPGDWIALQVSGDSMDRISPPESIIFVNRRDKRLVANACYVIADEDGGATYKRYRPGPDRFEPVSVNPEHEAHFPDTMPRIIGRVRRTMLDM